MATHYLANDLLQRLEPLGLSLCVFPLLLILCVEDSLDTSDNGDMPIFRTGNGFHYAQKGQALYFVLLNRVIKAMA